MTDLKMVFRRLMDVGTKRSMMTPDTPQLLLNLDNFVEWNNAEINGHKIITEKVLKQISALRRHIERGCLSNIEVSGGTNYNEALHRHLNPHFTHAGQMGIQLAYALLTVMLFIHNCKKEAPGSPLIKILAVNMHKVTKEQEKGMPRPFGVVGNKIDVLAPATSNEVVSDEGHSVIPFIDVHRIMKRAISSATLANRINEMVKSKALFSYRMIPYMSSVPSLYFHCLRKSSQHEAHLERLSSVLKTCGMVKYIMAGDGDCCFLAIGFSMQENSLKMNDDGRKIWESLGINVSTSLAELATTLRHLAVREWLNNPEYYESF